MIAAEALINLGESTENNLPTGPEDLVYHVTLQDRLGSIQQGLRPNPERGEKDGAWRALEELFDEVRPDRVCTMGIARRNAVFAHPGHDTIERIYEKATSSMRKDGQRLAALALSVDPEKVLVCDSTMVSAIFLGCPIFYTDKPILGAHTVKQAAAYWERSATLAQYRQHYEIVHTDEGSQHTKKVDAPEDLPPLFYTPEVLVPGTVHADRMYWVSSSTYALEENDRW